MKSLLKKWYTSGCRLYLKNGKEENKLCIFYTFPHNNNGWLEEVLTAVKCPVTLVYRPQVFEEIEELKTCFPHVDFYNIASLSGWLGTLKAIKTSQDILLDNYEPLLASVTSTTQRRAMIWHATGAIKQFGACDPKNKERTQSDCARFKAVYEGYTDFLVGSQKMADVFKKSYLATEDKIRLLGFVRSDALVNQSQAELKASFLAKNQAYQNKTLILYAPTYREDSEARYPIDLATIEATLPNSKVICRYHPHHKEASTTVLGSYAELLAACDYCITDYSSLPFDYTLLHPQGHVVLYQYDVELYKERYGLEPLFFEDCPFPCVTTQEDLLLALQEAPKEFTSFNQEWNTYNDGQATGRLIEWLGENK